MEKKNYRKRILKEYKHGDPRTIYTCTAFPTYSNCVYYQEESSRVTDEYKDVCFHNFCGSCLLKKAKDQVES